MKTILGRIMQPRLWAAALAVLLIQAAVGQEKKGVVIDLMEVRKSLGVLQDQIGGTVQMLDSLKDAAKAGSDLKGPYAKFQKEVESLNAHVDKLRGQGTQMRARADEHYKAWQTQLSSMQNPKLRDKAQNRYDDVKEEFDKIIVNAEEAKRELAPFMADLKDVSSYLAIDLSNDSVKSLNNTIWKLGNRGSSVTASIRHVSEQINKTLELQPKN